MLRATGHARLVALDKAQALFCETLPGQPRAARPGPLGVLPRQGVVASQQT